MTFQKEDRKPSFTTVTRQLCSMGLPVGETSYNTGKILCDFKLCNFKITQFKITQKSFERTGPYGGQAVVAAV